ncbi:MAG: hypothetical protein WAK91_04620, partial [Candidatus Acidiferrales bacterium]
LTGLAAAGKQYGRKKNDVRLFHLGRDSILLGISDGGPGHRGHTYMVNELQLSGKRNYVKFL